MLSQNQVSLFFDLVNKSKNILILNSKPDGDSIGASIALNNLLLKLNKKPDSITVFQIPEYLRFLTEKGKIKFTDIEKEEIVKYDLIILVDTSDIKRSLNSKELKFDDNAKFVCIDHHAIESENNLDLRIIESDAESTCGVILDIFNSYEQAENLELIDANIAFLLFTGIVSDTDYFGYNNVSKETFQRAAVLRSYDFDPVPIIKQFRESLSLNAFKFVQRNISRVVINEDKRYAYLKVKKENLTEDDNITVISEATNYVNRAIIRIIDIVDFSFILREVNEETTSLGLRLHNNGNETDLNKIALKFGGGGHTKAAGAVIKKKIDEVEKEITTYLNNLIV